MHVQGLDRVVPKNIHIKYMYTAYVQYFLRGKYHTCVGLGLARVVH